MSLPPMQINDPAWFYSSLSQVSAAIVGLIGAVLGTRIIDHIALVRSERETLDQQIKNVRTTFQNNSGTLRGFQNYLDRQIGENEQAISRGEHVIMIRHEQSWGGSWSGGGGQERNLPDFQELLHRRRRDLAKVLPIYESPLAGKLENLDSLIGEFGITETLKDADAKQFVRGECERLTGLKRHIGLFRSKLLPSSFIVVFVLLAFLAAAGIIWPLAALPGLSDFSFSKKGMLWALGLGVLGILAYFGYQLIELRKLGNLSWEPE